MRFSEDVRQFLFDTQVVSSNLAKNLILVHDHNVSFIINRIKIDQQLATQADSQKHQTFSLFLGLPVMKNEDVVV